MPHCQQWDNLQLTNQFSTVQLPAFHPGNNFNFNTNEMKKKKKTFVQLICQTGAGYTIQAC